MELSRVTTEHKKVLKDIPRQLDEMETGLNELRVSIDGFGVRLESVLRLDLVVDPGVIANEVEEDKEDELAPLARILRDYNEQIRVLKDQVGRLNKGLQI